ncbi:hypothetical protein M422DRAFT_247459 [Sphaerobolus stellatus SS14]|nr:hypothetical protein M422DRAFT_247459 [Sphaerobolus stellatus SS14]
MSNPLLITGATPRPPPGTVVNPRIEIATFIRDIRQFSLYVQALQALYDEPRENVASYWQISGVHGMPYVDWNGSPSGGSGYCVHGTDLFPTWHRSYVVLFEQEVQRHALRIASTYTHDQLTWEQAAASLRQPYWGWDEIATVVPPAQIISSPTVRIIGPNSPLKVTVANPFLAYRYPPGANSVFSPPHNGWPKTTRYPFANGKSEPIAFRSALQMAGPQLVLNTQRLYSLTTWTEFRTGSGSTSGLESIHGTVHVRAGGPNGNMSLVSVASFDPIFYLHHAQIDRVIELWYRIHRTWTADRTGLAPFRQSLSNYWASPNIIDSTQVFNYSYPLSAGMAAPASDAGVSAPTGDIVINEWSVRIVCKQFEIGGSFSVFVFLGEVPANPKQWLTDPAFAGTFDAFVNENPEKCANCGDHADDLIKGFVHINDKFLQRSKQTTLDPAVIEPYLTQNLNWAIQKANGEVARLEDVPSLQVTVLVTPLTLPVGVKFPVEGKPKFYHGITRGRVGGYFES